MINKHKITKFFLTNNTMNIKPDKTELLNNYTSYLNSKKTTFHIKKFDNKLKRNIFLLDPKMNYSYLTNKNKKYDYYKKLFKTVDKSNNSNNYYTIESQTTRLPNIISTSYHKSMFSDVTNYISKKNENKKNLVIKFQDIEKPIKTRNKTDLLNDIDLIHKSYKNKTKISFSNTNDDIENNEDEIYSKTSSSEIAMDYNNESNTNFARINSIIKKTNLEEIRDIVLPEMKQIYDNLGYINLKFYTPKTLIRIKNLSEIFNQNHSQKIHELKTNFLISQEIKEYKKDMNRIKNAVNDKRTKEEIEEANDFFFDEDLKETKLKRLIKNFLGAKDNKLNQLQFGREPFFENFENKVNFIYDINQIPNIKNNFIDLSSKINNLNEYKNVIDYGINNYLCTVRFNIQKNKDEKYFMLNNPIEYRKKEKLKKKEMESKYKKNRKNIDDDNYLKNKEEEDKYSVIYILENFFRHKFLKYNNIGFTNEKIKSIIYKQK